MIKQTRNLVVALAAIVLAACASAGTDVHVLGQGTWSNEPTAPAATDQRVAEAATRYAEYGHVARIALFDVAYPASDAELTDTAGNGVLLLTLLSQDREELPPARLFVSVAGESHELRLITATPIRLVEDAGVSKVLGRHRWDGLYVFPVGFARDGAVLTVDFAKNRTGFVAGEFSDSHYEVLLYRTPRPNVAPSDASPPDAVMALVAREFPGFVAGDAK